MLIKIYDLEYSWEWDSEKKLNLPQIQHSTEVWINPDRVTFVYPKMRLYPEQGLIKCGGERYYVTTEDALRIIDHINGTSAAPQPAAAPINAHRLVHVDSMYLDSFYSKTAQAARRMWRCTSEEGISFNIFDHVDHRNTYKLFQEANLDILMDNMHDGDTLDFGARPIEVFLQENGDFFNPVKIGELDQIDQLGAKIIRAQPAEDEDDNG